MRQLGDSLEETQQGHDIILAAYRRGRRKEPDRNTSFEQPMSISSIKPFRSDHLIRVNAEIIPRNAPNRTRNSTLVASRYRVLSLSCLTLGLHTWMRMYGTRKVASGPRPILLPISFSQIQ